MVDALVRLAALREQAGDQEGAETLYREAVDHGMVDALVRLAALREQAGDQEGAETLYRQAVDHGSVSHPYGELVMLRDRLWPSGLDPDGTPAPRWK